MQGLGNDFVVVDATRAPFTLTPSQIRTLADRRFGVGCDQVLVVEPLDVGGTVVEVSALSMGNPHAVQVVDDIDAAPVTTQGPLVEHHPRFPHRVNAGYMQVVDRANIRLRVWERGVGETPACGTGACAAVVAGVRRGLLDSNVRVATRGGNLSVSWKGDEHSVSMKGAATSVENTLFGLNTVATTGVCKP